MNSCLLDHYDKYVAQMEEPIDRNEKYNHLLSFINEYKLFLQKKGVHVKKRGFLNFFFPKHIFYNPLYKRIEWKSTFGVGKGMLHFIPILKIKCMKRSNENPSLLYLYCDDRNKAIEFLFQNEFDLILFYDGIIALQSII